MKYLLNKARLLLFFLPAFFISWNTMDKWIVLKREIKDNWHIQSSAIVDATGQEISNVNFENTKWYPAIVPGSILGSLVADSVYKNIFFGRNLKKIPSKQFDTPWWYRTTFAIAKLSPQQVALLHFDGINYRADVWLNGKQIASSDTLKGGFCRFDIDISKAIKEGENVLAVKVFRPQPGEPTLGFVDWNPAPPDHNMGIWRSVFLQLSGPIAIEQPFVQSKVDTSTLKHADLTVSTLLHNYSGKEITGEIKGMIGEEISFSQEVTMPAGTSKKVSFIPSRFSQLSINNPRLWWVHTLGNPSLYDLRFQFIADEGISDSSNTRFGIRSVSDYFTADGHRGYKLNGKKILIKGGGWTDPMLLNATPEYENAGIDYAVHMNLNAIRMEGFWGSNEHIYDLCDEKGILIMVGFSCQWEWKNLMDNEDDKYNALLTPEQNDIAASSWHDQVLWLRNHPSIFTWLYGSDKWPRPSLEKRYLAILKNIDPTRPAVSSAKEVMSAITGRSGLKMRGPYDYVPPVYWYVDTTYGGAFGFNTETGPGPQIPVLESIKKMIPADSLWPIGSAWNYHAARGKFHNLKNYTNALGNRLGKAEGLHDYLRKAQYLNYEGMRAMFEAFESNRFRATGIIQWMYNSSWPKLWWQLYDFYLMPTGAFYGAKKANEPLHISYNYGNNGVDIFNNTAKNAKVLSAEISMLDFNLKPVFNKTITLVSVGARKTNQVFTLPSNLKLSKTWFLDLRLYDEQHKEISNNFYVLSTTKDKLNVKKSTWYITPQTQYANLTMLQHLPFVTLGSSVSISQKNGDTYVKVKLKNPTNHLAFMVYLDMKKKESNESVLPIFWDENYITLLPGEERTITGYCHTSDLHGEQVTIDVSGWNVNEETGDKNKL